MKLKKILTAALLLIGAISMAQGERIEYLLDPFGSQVSSRDSTISASYIINQRQKKYLDSEYWYPWNVEQLVEAVKSLPDEKRKEGITLVVMNHHQHLKGSKRLLAKTIEAFKENALKLYLAYEINENRTQSEGL